MRILLMTAPKDGECIEGSTPSYLIYDFANYPPLGLLAIAAKVNSRHTVKVVDAVTKNMSNEDVIAYVRDYKPDVFGISLVSRRIYPSYYITQRIKEVMPSVVTIAGGPHINDWGKETIDLGTLDYAMAGYCEFTFPMLIEAIEKIKNGADQTPLLKNIPGLFYRSNGKVIVNPPDPAPQILDDMPFPKRDLVDLSDYYTAADKVQMTTMYTSRGCPYKCTFCDVQEKKYNYRSTDKIVDEFEYIMSLGIKEIHIFDDTFNLNKKRVYDMCNEILRRKLDVRWTARVRVNTLDRDLLVLMKKSGCSRLHAGIESLDQRALEIMRKQITPDDIKRFFSLCRELKIETLAYMILGFPEETLEYRKNFYKKLIELRPTYVFINILYPLAKTKIYYDLLENGFYEKDYWRDLFTNPVPNFDLPRCRSAELQRELVRLMDSAHKRFYLSPRFVINDLRRNASLKMLFLKARLAVRLFLADTQNENVEATHHSAPFQASTRC